MRKPRLDIRHLAMIEAIARLGSISGAARSLGLTQPALSRQLQEAERRLGVELMQRADRRIQLTIAGETILECARRVLPDLAESERSAAQIPEEPIVPLRISLGQYDDYGWFPAFFAYAEQHEPSINLCIFNSGEASFWDMLDGNQVDVAIVAGPVDRRRFRVTNLFSDELVAIMHPGSALAHHAFLEAEHFKDQVYATYGVTYQKGFESDRVLLPAGVWPRRTITAGSCQAIMELVGQGAAISVLSKWIATPALREGRLVVRRIGASGLPVDWSAATRRADGPDSAAWRLADHLCAWCKVGPERFAGTGYQSNTASI